MPIIRLGRERESLTYTGEAFKSAVRQYLESLGYSQTTDSYIEGHLQDMVFVNRDVDPGRLFYVEAKATKVSLRQKDFCSPPNTHPTCAPTSPNPSPPPLPRLHWRTCADSEPVPRQLQHISGAINLHSSASCPPRCKYKE